MCVEIRRLEYKTINEVVSITTVVKLHAHLCLGRTCNSKSALLVTITGSWSFTFATSLNVAERFQRHAFKVVPVGSFVAARIKSVTVEKIGGVDLSIEIIQVDGIFPVLISQMEEVAGMDLGVRER